MGKSRRSRGKSARHDPLTNSAKPPKPPTDPELAALREAKILPVLKDLQSSEAKRRTAAAGAVANIVNDARCRKLLLREQVVRIVLEGTITDSAIESRAAGWEILRVLADKEEADFCVHLFRRDIVTALSYASMLILETARSESPEFAKLPRAQQTITWTIATSLVSLINDVALATPDALTAITTNDYIMQILFLLIEQPIVPPPVHQASLACLWALSEDNKPFAELVVLGSEAHNLNTLRHLTTTWSDSAATACGVLHNIIATLGWNGEDHGPGGLSDATLVKPLADIIRSFGPGGSTEEGYRIMEPEHVQIALEILASMGTELQVVLSSSRVSEEWNGIDADGVAHNGGDSEDEDIPIGDSDADDDDDDEKDDTKEEDGQMDNLPTENDEGDDHEMAMDDILADIDMVTGDGPDDSDDDVLESNADIPLLKEFCRRAIPELIRLVTANLETEPEYDISGHALSALNNIAWSVSCLDFSDDNNEAAAKTWRPAGRAIWDSVVTSVLASDTADLELASKITGLAWAVARTLHGSFGDTDAHRKFMALYQATKGMPPSPQQSPKEQQQKQNPEEDSVDPFQALGVKCIGVLGQLAMNPAPAAVNREIGVFLLTVLRGLPETPVADVVEALNQLMDVYGDEQHPCDKEVFWADKFLAHLEEVRHPVKMAVKKVDKRASEELRTRADEAVLNLGRFIQYKKKHKPA